GMEAHKQGQLDAAIAEFRRATEIEPKLAPAFVNLGQAYMEKRDYGDAIAPLKRALELNQDLAGARQLLGYALLAAGYAAEAIPYLEQVNEQGALGIAQLETGRLPEAVSNLQAALAKRPNDPDLLYYLGRASGLLSKDVTDALISAYPGSFRAHQALGENYFALRRLPEAEKEYREALRLRPEVPGLHLALGQVYAIGAQWVKAEEEFRAEAGLQPGSSEAAYRLGSALLQQGKSQAAQAELERSDHLKPEMPETLYSLGKAASLNGDAAAAEKAWTRVIEIEKESSLAAQAHFGLAALYRKQGRLQDAARETEEFRKLQNKKQR
ncbi:MAG: tetratricopeptide repeat protein, partial [Blastocatellia bacterium]|nr:tetratricopeptide repeat protein [Blastocatellia bacterium]